jgi:uroporphyrinogen-III synthase
MGVRKSGVGHMISSNALSGKVIAVPEARECAAFSGMLRAHGATVHPCALLEILDAPDAESIKRWLDALIRTEFDDVIFMTGEGIRRLIAVADQSGRKSDVVHALKKTRKITRGPKPARELTALGLKVDLAAEIATTEGIIATLESENISGRRIGVQLFGDDPNDRLIGYLKARNAAPIPVVAYVYASNSDDARCVELIRKMIDGRIDLIAFTSAAQVKRLREVARKHALDAQLEWCFKHIRVAAIGPVAAAEFDSYAVRPLVAQAPLVLKNFVQTICAQFQHAPL